MDRFNPRQVDTSHRFRQGVGWSMAGFVAAAAIFIAAPGSAADWLAPAADQIVTAPWVKDIAAQLEQDVYRDVLMNALGNSPQAEVVRYLNNAAQALQAGNRPLAQSYLNRTIAIFDNGVQRGYYSRADVEPIKNMIRTRAKAAIKGEMVTTAIQSDDRWTGYTHDKPLGLTNDETRMTSEHPEVKK